MQCLLMSNLEFTYTKDLNIAKNIIRAEKLLHFYFESGITVDKLNCMNRTRLPFVTWALPIIFLLKNEDYE